MEKTSNILINILIIGLIIAIAILGGIIVVKTILHKEVQNIKNTIPENESIVVQSFNSQFISYVGKQSVGATRTLVQAVQMSNATQIEQVSIKYKGKTYSKENELKELQNNIKISSSAYYNISIKYASNGYINIIDITE